MPAAVALVPSVTVPPLPPKAAVSFAMLSMRSPCWSPGSTNRRRWCSTCRFRLRWLTSCRADPNRGSRWLAARYASAAPRRARRRRCRRNRRPARRLSTWRATGPSREVRENPGARRNRPSSRRSARRSPTGRPRAPRPPSSRSPPRASAGRKRETGPARRIGAPAREQLPLLQGFELHRPRLAAANFLVLQRWKPSRVHVLSQNCGGFRMDTPPMGKSDHALRSRADRDDDGLDQRQKTSASSRRRLLR